MASMTRDPEMSGFIRECYLQWRIHRHWIVATDTSHTLSNKSHDTQGGDGIISYAVRTEKSDGTPRVLVHESSQVVYLKEPSISYDLY